MVEAVTMKDALPHIGNSSQIPVDEESESSRSLSFLMPAPVCTKFLAFLQGQPLHQYWTMIFIPFSTFPEVKIQFLTKYSASDSSSFTIYTVKTQDAMNKII